MALTVIIPGNYTGNNYDNYIGSYTGSHGARFSNLVWDIFYRYGYQYAFPRIDLQIDEEQYLYSAIGSFCEKLGHHIWMNWSAINPDKMRYVNNISVWYGNVYGGIFYSYDPDELDQVGYGGGASGGASGGWQTPVPPTGTGKPNNQNSDFPKERPKKAEYDCGDKYSHKVETNELDSIMFALQPASHPMEDGTNRIFPGIDVFENAVNGNNKIEYGFTILKMDGQYYGHHKGVQPGTATNVSIEEDPFMVATIHNHPVDPNTGKASPPSPLDLIVTVNQAIEHPNFEGSYIYWYGQKNQLYNIDHRII